MALNPMRWPYAWSSASLERLKGSGIDCLIGVPAELTPAARSAGFTVVAAGETPQGVNVLTGVWPGIRISGSNNSVSAGPTGEPWVDSNVWRVRLARARKPEAAVWIQAEPDPKATPSALAYTAAIADAALTGGRWIVSLDTRFAGEIAAQKPEALATWRKIVSTTKFFAEHGVWDAYQPAAVLGIVSEFSNSFDEEALNLITRSGQQYRVIPLERLRAEELAGLRAALVIGEKPPVRTAVAVLNAFAAAGGQIVADRWWNTSGLAAQKDSPHPRFERFRVGKGGIAVSKTELADPYLLASDVAILVSHRYDPVRFWNGGALSAYYSASNDKRRAVLQTLFYADRPPETAGLRIAGDYRRATLSMPDWDASGPIAVIPQPGAVEVHLPRISQYAAIELSA
jgi:hypothetical protein